MFDEDRLMTETLDQMSPGNKFNSNNAQKSGTKS